MRPFPLSPLFPAVLALAAAQAGAQEFPVRSCATLLQGQERFSPSGESILAARAQAAHRSGRTLLTPRLAIHYTVAPTVHRVRWTPEDAGLRATVDSVLAALPADLLAYQRDSSLHAELDARGAPHPLFVQRAAAHLEMAWAHYDSVGMRMPDYASASTVFNAPAQGRYVVDIADVNQATFNAGPNYGLTWPPGSGGSIVIENDFLYNATYDAATDQVTGLPVQTTIAGQPRNYHVDWEMGLKVTAIHELYHAVQLAYVPVLPTPRHAWYEIGAVGMEERLAPEVNDYFQYLFAVVPDNHVVNVLNPLDASFRNYGNGIFHIFLTRALGPDFDRPVWERLETNGNNLPDALVQGLGSQARWDSLFAAYAAAMSLAGSPAALTSPLAFTADMAQWPRPRFDSVNTAAVSLLDVYPGTYRLVPSPPAGGAWAGIPGIDGAWRVSFEGAQTLFLSGSAMPLQGPGNPVLAVANPAFPGGTTRLLTLTPTTAGLTALPNPASRTGPFVGFSAPEGILSDTLVIVSESGRRIATLAPDTTGTYWSWDLKDEQERTVSPGVYHFRTPGRDAQPLLIVP